MSRKFVIFRLLSMVMFRPSCLNILVISFLMLSVLLPEMSLKTASPSSLYRPGLKYASWWASIP